VPWELKTKTSMGSVPGMVKKYPWTTIIEEITNLKS
jgi:hypothetical protein